MNGSTNGAMNGSTNGAMNGSTNGAMNGAMNGSTNGAMNGAMNVSINGSTNGAISIDTTFPFTLDYIKKIFNDIRVGNMTQMIATSSPELEILVQILQTNLEASYKYLTERNFNKLNDLIMNIKLKKQQIPVRELSQSQNNYLKTMMTKNKYIDDSGFINNITDTDMSYSIYTPEQNRKLGANDETLNNGWKNDYVLLNTDRWAPPINSSMYKCKTEKTCPVCPMMTTGYPVKLKEFDLARKILPPDNINIDYINEKLITGMP